MEKRDYIAELAKLVEEAVHHLKYSDFKTLAERIGLEKDATTAIQDMLETFADVMPPDLAERIVALWLLTAGYITRELCVKYDPWVATVAALFMHFCSIAEHTLFLTELIQDEKARTKLVNLTKKLMAYADKYITRVTQVIISAADSETEPPCQDTERRELDREPPSPRSP